MQNPWLFSSKNICWSAKKRDEKKSKECEETLAKLNSAHCCSQAKCECQFLVQASYFERIKLFLFSPYNKHLVRFMWNNSYLYCGCTEIKVNIELENLPRWSLLTLISILLTAPGRSVWENLDLDRVYRPHCIVLYSRPRSRSYHTDLLLGW